MDVLSDPRKHVVLRNNVKMPILGLGTSHTGGYSEDAVVHALRNCGYRLIDTAKRYGVEAAIAAAIQASSVCREDVFLTTKCWPTDYGGSRVADAVMGSCHRFDTHYIDLYLLHWPVVPSTCPDRGALLRETWRKLELLLDEGVLRSIGVSNFTAEDLLLLMDQPELSVDPMLDQCEMHPYNNPILLRRFCQHHDIQFQGFCPLGHGTLLRDPVLEGVAGRCRRSPAQVLIRWNLQHQVVCIPKSTKPERVQQNSQVFDFTISDEDMAILDSLPQCVTIMDRADIQEKVDNPLPDGYRLTARDTF